MSGTAAGRADPLDAIHLDDLPEGTLTVLFTDVAGSTALTMALGDAGARERLRAIEGIVQEQVRLHRGVEVKRLGDGVMAAFQSARRAIEAAVAIQRALSAHERTAPPPPVQLRIGINAGEVIREDGDLFGLAVHAARRIESLAAPGEILVAEGVRALLGAAPGLTLEDRGEHLLKGFDEPWRLFAVAWAPETGERRAPPVVAAPAPGSRLPPVLTSFVGRHDELDAIAARLVDPNCRILTLVGPGGIGKTRLSVEVARRVEPAFADGAVFVAFQGVQPDAPVEAELAAALGLSSGAGETALQQITAALQDRDILVVADNFEHLTEQAGVLSEIARNTPSVTFLISSREVLNVAEEWVFAVEGLPLPEGDAAEPAPAVQLFAERARRLRHDFALEAERAGIEAICRLVEGMPLAIELSAAWTKTMTCDEIAAEIGRGMDILTSSLRDMPGHHRSMAVMIDHSWALLDERERGAFMRLSVFRGGFTRAAAGGVAGADLALLGALADKSLIRRRPGGRFSIHELLRQYGEARLVEAGLLDAIRDAHAAWFLGALERWHGDLAGGDQVGVAEEARADLANIRAAVQRAIATGAISGHPLALDSLSMIYEGSSAFGEAVRVFGEAVARLDAEPVTAERALALVEALIGSGNALMRVGHIDASEDALLRARELMAAFDLEPIEGQASDPGMLLGLVALIRGQADEAERLGRIALERAERARHRWNQHYALYVLTRVAVVRGDYETGRAHALRAHDLVQQSGDQWFLAYVLNELGGIATALGEYDEARGYFDASFALRERTQEPEGMAVAQIGLANVAFLQGDTAEAGRRYRWALERYRDTGDAGGTAGTLCGMGRVATQTGNTDAAARYLREALSLASQAQFVPRILGVLAAIAELYSACGRLEPAVEILAFVQAHPGCEDETAELAAYVAAHIERRLPSAAFTGATRRGQDETEDQLVPRLLTELLAIETHRDAADPTAAPAIDLTPREQEILALIAAGKSNREIAEELVVAVGTVKAHTAAIYGKLGVANRVRAIARARQLGLLPPL